MQEKKINLTFYEKVKSQAFSSVKLSYGIITIVSTLSSLSYFWPDVDVYVGRSMNPLLPFYSQIMVNNKSHFSIQNIEPHVKLDTVYLNRHGQNSRLVDTNIGFNKKLTLTEIPSSSEMPFYFMFSQIFSKEMEQEFSFISAHFTMKYEYIGFIKCETTVKYVCDVDSKGEAFWTKIPE